VSTCYHLARTLCYEGYLVRLPSGDYVAGAGVAEQFHELMNSLRRPPRARAVLRHLAGTTRHTAYLACISGQRLMIVDLAEGDRSPWLEDLQPGLETAAHATALGKALLATLPGRDRESLLTAHGMRPFTRNTVTERAAIEIRSPSSGSTGTTCAARASPCRGPSPGPGGRWAPRPVAWTCPPRCSANCSAPPLTSRRAGERPGPCPNLPGQPIPNNR
jgi:hypothetical protein